jgi:hypothetical protein
LLLVFVAIFWREDYRGGRNAVTHDCRSNTLNDVKQTGQKVEFGMRIAHGAFQGTLNKEGTELAGQFAHEESSVPLTLRKMAGQPTK